MAINVDISKITGINQVGNSYQRKSAVPLDYYSLFNTKAEAEAYAASNPVSYVGQVISYIDNGEVKVCVIANADGLLREVGTKPVGDGKTIEVSAEGAVALLGAASAANGTLPMIEEVEGESKLVWKTLEQIGAGDGNDNTTYAFAFADQKITITPSLNGVAQDAIEVDLSVFVTEDELAAAIEEAIEALPEDKNTTYTLSLSGMELTLTPSEGEADVVTIDAYTKKEIDDKFDALPEDENTTYTLSQSGMAITLTPSEGEAQTVTVDAYSKSEVDALFEALPEDKDTTYTAKVNDKVLTLNGTEFSTEISLKHENGRISLTGKNGEEIAGFSDADFIEDGVLQDVEYDAENRNLIFTWNIVTGTDDEGNIIYKTDVVSVADLVDTYTAGQGISIENNIISVKRDPNSEVFLSFDPVLGMSIVGVQDAINKALVEAKKYADDNDANTTYAAGNGLELSADNKFSIKVVNAATDLEDSLLISEDGIRVNDNYVIQVAGYSIGSHYNNTVAPALDKKADKDSVYTKTEADNLLNAKANASDVYTKTEADNLLNNKANSADVYSKTEADNLLSAKANAADVYAKSETYTQKQVDDLLEGVQAGSSESAASVNTKLEALKKTLNNEIYGNDEGTGDSRIDTAETKLATIAEGAQVNVIESVAKKDADCRIVIETNGKAVTIDDANLRNDISNAKQAGIDAGTVASRAESAASQNAQAIQGHATKIGNLETLTGQHSTDIANLQAADTAHNALYEALKSTVDGHTSQIAGKADQSAVDAAAQKASTNEQAIKTLNETTIPAINGEIAKKADADKVYTKTEIGAIAENKTIVQMIADAQAAATYDDTKVKEDIQKNATAIENITKEGGAIAVAVKAEADRAAEAEQALADDIAEINALLNTVSSEDNITSLKELAIWVEEHGGEASRMAESIKANADAIELINDAEKGVLVQAEAYSDANLATAKKYTDDEIAKIHGVDDKTIKLNDSNKAYVAEVSTDVLVQGSLELVFCAGNASGFATN